MMLTVKYDIVEEIYHCDGKTWTSYGIVAYDSDGVTVLTSIHDISTDMKAVAALAEQCNRAELSVEHLGDVVEDFINA